MTNQQIPPDPGPWRVGEHYKIHVYEGDRPVATFHNPEDAQAAVDAYNSARHLIQMVKDAKVGQRQALRLVGANEGVFKTALEAGLTEAQARKVAGLPDDWQPANGAVGPEASK